MWDGRQRHHVSECTMPNEDQSPALKPKPPFTTVSRILCILAIAATGGAMWWVATSDAMDGTKKLLAEGCVLMAGMLVIAGAAFYSDGKHRRN